MADPAIQTFCCVKLAKKTNPAFYAMMEFNSTPYNLICLVSSVIGIMGASYQIKPPNTYLRHKHRSITLVCLRGRKIIVWLAAADLMATLGVFVRSVVNLSDLIVEEMWMNNVGMFFCTFISAWIQYWYCVTWLWTLCYTFDVALALQDKNANYVLYHTFCWTVPAILTGIGLFYLYYPEGSCIDIGANDEVFVHVLPNYIVTYLPMISVMLLNPLLYCYAGKYVNRMVCHSLGQFTNKEREIVDSTYLTFVLVNLVFYVCWLPNLFSTFIIWTMWHRLTERLVLILWYVMAVVNPMQALFNCLVYNHFSTKMNAPWAPVPPQVTAEESTPLLGHNRSEPSTSTAM